MQAKWDYVSVMENTTEITTEINPIKDARSLDHKTLEAIRFRAVSAVLRGHSPETVIDIFGFSRCSIYVWLKLYREGGWEALRARPLEGRPSELDAKG